MTNFDMKILENFPGKVVRKDLTSLMKKGANVPTYVLEYLLGMYCATDDEEAFTSVVNTNNGTLSSFTTITTLIDNGEKCGEEMTDFPVNSEGVAYRYYIFAARKSSANVYEIALKTE